MGVNDLNQNMWESIIGLAMAPLLCRTHTWLPKCGQLRDPSGFLRLSFIGSWLVLHNDFWRSDPPLLFPFLARLPLDKYLCKSRPPSLIDLCVLNIWLAIPPYHPQKCAILSELACESQQSGEEHLKYGASIDKNTTREYTVHGVSHCTSLRLHHKSKAKYFCVCGLIPFLCAETGLHYMYVLALSHFLFN